MLKSRSIRLVLIAFALAVTAPLFVALGIFIWRSAEAERANYEQGLLRNAGDFAEDLDRDLQRRFAILGALAVSSTLREEDWPKFYAEAGGLTDHAFVVLIDDSLRQIINTRTPYGQAPPITGDPETARTMLQTRERAVSNLFISLVTNKPVFSVNIPILEDGAVKFILIYALEPDDLLTTMRGQHLPPGFVSSVWDGNNVVLARSRNHDRYVGTTLPPRLAKVGDGLSENLNLEGVPVIRAVVHMKNAPWRVSVAMPVELVTAHLVRSI